MQVLFKIENLETVVNKYTLSMRGQDEALKFTSYALTFHSAVMEGCFLNERQVYNLLDLDIATKTRPFSEQLMVFDHHKALTFVLNEAKKHTPLSEELIRQVEALVMKNTGLLYNTPLGVFNSTLGEYRLLNTFAGSRRFPKCTEVPELMKTLVSEINEKIEQAETFRQKCELAFELHYRILDIHPFADGNGRTARIFMNYLLARFDLPIFYVVKSLRTIQIRVLEKARQDEDINVFFDFLARQYQTFLDHDLSATILPKDNRRKCRKTC
jgi:Fic family protein